jgi:putative acetyltransferase
MHVTLESVNQPDIIKLIAELDAYQSSLYPPESNHLLDVESLKASNVLFAVARDTDVDRTALGCGAVVLLDGYGELKRMFVQPGQRGRGIAKAVMTHLEAQTVQRGCHLLRLETGIRQAEALGLYERAGYIRCARYGDYPDDPLSVFMEKKIGEVA